jgi:hypothetical protein
VTYVGVQADGKEKTMSTYYASDNGEVTCPSHGGMYFTSEIERNPKAKTVIKMDLFDNELDVYLTTVEAAEKNNIKPKKVKEVVNSIIISNHPIFMKLLLKLQLN